MKEYHKITTVFKRDPETKCKTLLMKLPRDYRGYEFAMPPDAGVVGYPEKRILIAFPKGVTVWHCVYNVDDKESFEDAVQWIKDSIKEEQ